MRPIGMTIKALTAPLGSPGTGRLTTPLICQPPPSPATLFRPRGFSGACLSLPLGRNPPSWASFPFNVLDLRQ